MNHYDREEGPDRGRAPWYLPGGGGAGPIYFYDGTWADEAAPATARYPTDQTTMHGNPGLRLQDYVGESPTLRREVFLRLKNPVRLRAGRDATIVIFMQGIRLPAREGGMDESGIPNQVQVKLGLLTALDQPTLEALTWNNRPASAEDHALVKVECGAVEFTVGEWDTWERPRSGFGNSTFDVLGWLVGAPPAAGEDCLALAVRLRPAATLTLAGIRLWATAYYADGSDAEAEGFVMRTRPGDPHRSFLIREKTGA
jgi:hypothetical protein